MFGWAITIFFKIRWTSGRSRIFQKKSSTNNKVNLKIPNVNFQKTCNTYYRRFFDRSFEPSFTVQAQEIFLYTFTFQVLQLEWWPVTRDSAMYAVAVGILIKILGDEKVYLAEAAVLVSAYLLYLAGINTIKSCNPNLSL